MRRRFYALHPRQGLNRFSGKLREGIMAAKRRDGFASDGLSLPLLVLRPLSQSHSLRNVPADLHPLRFFYKHRVNPLIPTSNLLYLPVVNAFERSDDSNRPLIAVGLLLPLPTRLLQTSSGVPCLRVHCTRFPNHFLVGFSRGGGSIVQLLQGGGSYPTEYLYAVPGLEATEIA